MLDRLPARSPERPRRLRASSRLVFEIESRPGLHFVFSGPSQRKLYAPLKLCCTLGCIACSMFSVFAPGGASICNTKRLWVSTMQIYGMTLDEFQAYCRANTEPPGRSRAHYPSSVAIETVSAAVLLARSGYTRPIKCSLPKCTLHRKGK